MINFIKSILPLGKKDLMFISSKVNLYWKAIVIKIYIYMKIVIKINTKIIK